MQRPWGRTILACWGHGEEPAVPHVPPAEEGREGEAGQAAEALVGCREDPGFDPKPGGSRGGLWAGEGQDWSPA